jgi:DNA primase
MCCPFHEDKTPSMQVYEKTNTVFCFSSNCKTHGKSLDVIDFVLFMENCTKHEAILKCISIGNLHEIKNTSTSFQSKSYEQKNEQSEQIKFLEKLFSYFKNGLNSSKPAKEYLKSRCLPFGVGGLEVGFNSGQFHYRENKTEELIENCLKYGLLIDKNLTSNTGNKAYQVFGKNCVVFPLKNADNEIVSFYFRSILTPTLSKGEGVSPPLEGLGGKHFYLKNRQGIYPNYPNVNTKKLILTESHYRLCKFIAS